MLTGHKKNHVVSRFNNLVKWKKARLHMLRLQV